MTSKTPTLPSITRRQDIFCALVLWLIIGAFSARADEYDTLRLKWLVLLNGGTNYNTSDPEIAAKITSLNSSGNGNWNSMVKTNGNARSYLWSDLASTNSSADITSCYGRLLTMATAWSTKGATLQNNTNLLNDIIGGLDWMYANRYNTNYANNAPYDNWWDWQVGAPQALNDVVVIVYSGLTATQISNYMGAVDFFTPVPTLTAANRTYTDRVVAVRGVIGKSSTKLSSARDGLDIIFPYTYAEGFHVDGSFIQHGEFPYTGGYGDALLNDLSRIMYLLSGSTWAITNTMQTNVYNWVPLAFEPVIYKGACLDMQRGRGISRSGEDHSTGHDIIHSIIRLTLVAPTNTTASFNQMTKYWIQTDTYRNVVTASPTMHDLLLAQAIRDNSSITPMSEPIANITFPEMDRVVHLRSGWGAGLAMFSDRIFNYESINGENLKGWHTGDGMVYVYTPDLSQYDGGFWPTVNPMRMPGTTVDTLALANGAYEAKLSSKDWVGGANILGAYGTAGMNYASVFSSLVARKSWFMFDNEIVALGSGITSTDNRTIETTVENRKLNSSGNNAFTVNGITESTTLGWSATLTNATWAWLAGNSNGADVGYYFPSPVTLKAIRESRTNSWSGIGSGSTNKLSNKFLTLWQDHGSNPANGTYSYVILPNMSSTQVSNYSAAPNISILAQSTNVHAVKENTLNLLAANFWEDGTNTVNLLTSHNKASVMTKEDPGAIEVAVSDPTQDNGIVRRVLTTADSYVNDGSSSNSNFGTQTSLVLKSAGVGYDRQSFIKFALAGNNLTNVTNATLTFLITSLPNGPAGIGLYQVTNDSWQETTITWANQPALGSLIGTLTASNENAWVSFNVTSFVNSQLSGNMVASFALVASTSNQWVSIASRESGTAPELDLANPSSGFVDLELARSATGTISSDSRVSVTQLTPTIKLHVNVNCYAQNSDTNDGIRGHTWRAKFALDTNAPTVSVTAPANNAFVRGSSVSVTANASDNVGVVGVQFKLDGANLGAEDITSPYSITWNTTGATDGAHTLTAVARDAAGNITTSSVINVTVDNIAPTGVSVTSPLNAARVGGTVTVSGNASDNIGVAGVQFLLDGANLGSQDTTSPYSVSWNTTTASDGTHTLSCKASDSAGNTTTSSTITVTVDNTGPTTTVTAPLAGTVVGGTSVNISATATDPAGVAGVQFKIDGANLGSEDTTLPFGFSWNPTSYSDGPHVITAVGRDTLNNTASSAGVTVIVDNTAPAISLTSPLNGQTVNGFLTLLTATATDANGVVGVQFRVNGVNLGAEDGSSPYQVAWNTLGLINGIYNLTAVARDGVGNMSTSAVVAVTVTNFLLQVNGGGAWTNTTIDSQQSACSFTFDASPSVNPIDGPMGLSSGPAGNYTNLACIVRFSTTGVIDARNGSVYVATNVIPYSAGSNYHFRITASVPTHTYSAYVTPEGGTEQLIGANYAFRTEQAGVTVLNNFAITTATTNAVLKAWNPLALDNALVSWHRMDETFGTTAFDSTTNGYNGTLFDATWATGGLGGAVALDGVDDYVQVPANQWNLTNGLTLSTWVFSSAARSWESFINFGNGNANQNIMLYRDNTNANVKFAVYNGTNLSAILVSNVLVLNAWQQLTVTLGPTGSVSVFTNGVFVQSATINAAPTVLRTNNMFGRASGGGGYHQGALDDVRFYTRPLSTNEVFLLP